MTEARPSGTARVAPDGVAVVSRFAPSPNGPLHLGHAFSALSAWTFARQRGGRCLLRIEDIDLARSRQEYIDGIFDDLRWLGLTWDGPVMRQSDHFADYVAAADRLRAMGLLYRCFASRRDIAAAITSDATDPEGVPLYPGLHRGMAEGEVQARIARGEPFCWRLDMARAIALARTLTGGLGLTFMACEDDGEERTVEAEAERWGDVVLVRKDTPTSYHLSVVVDDARQGITHVTRGLDLFPATGLHRLLQVLLGLPEPKYVHHRLVLGADGRKLSKSQAAPALAELRTAGVSGADVVRRLGFNLLL